MANIKEHSLSFRSGVSLGADEGKVIAQLGPHPDPEFPESQIMEWSKQNGWSSTKINLTAIRMCVLNEPGNQLVVMGKGGYVVVMSDGQITEEMVDESDKGPRFKGNIRDMRLIGNHLYAAGMSRQVYRREGFMHWVHCDQGVVQQPPQLLEIAGFSTIDGLTESDIYAAGFEGEIWHYDGRTWHQIDSPTNLILHRIRVIEPNLVFASGQKGLLLQGSQEVWKPIEHDVTTDNLWGMEWFEEQLHVAGDHAIYRLDGDQLEVVDTGLGDLFTYRHLHANRGAMWSFGPKHIAKTDGKTWMDVTPRRGTYTVTS